MLELRPICENCATPLPPEAADAMICSFECTFCSHCVAHVLQNCCPNCGGGFEKRPVRPAADWRGGNDIHHYPPVSKLKHRPVDPGQQAAFAQALSLVAPEQR